VLAEGSFEEKGNKNTRRVSGTLPEMWLEATENVEKVIRGYGATDNTRLLLQFGVFEKPTLHHYARFT
jgi:hypothetical protein